MSRVVERSDIVTISVKDIAAQCPDCGETRFRRHSGESAEAIYRCVSCDRVVPRSELLNQIGNEAARRSRTGVETPDKKNRSEE